MINVREYQCNNDQCDITTVTETYDGFLDAYSRMTERCADFICTLAMETSCEGCARICKAMNIKIGGDTIIRLLTKRFELQEDPVCGTVVGVDDFAFKKRYKYGTIIVDEASHKPIAILDGRDGKSLKDWLANNKHIKAVTRDRASAYATAIQEVLPDVMQIADRFHLHQNLLEVIRTSLNSIIPATIKIPKEMADEAVMVAETEAKDESSKKTLCNVDNFSEFDDKRVQIFNSVHKLHSAGYSNRGIAKLLHIGRPTVVKYANGDFEALCRKTLRSGMDAYHDYIVKSLKAGMSRKGIYSKVIGMGFQGKITGACDYMNKLSSYYSIDVSLYRRTSAETIQRRKNLQKYDYLTRAELFKSLWMNQEISPAHKTFVFSKYPQLPLFYFFIEKYKDSTIKAVSVFTKGLERDIEAVENAVSSNLSNGFVEGTVNKLKMTKRVMYGRCREQLLAAKLMYNREGK